MKPMEKLGYCTIDELRQIALPDELGNEPGWEIGEKVSIHYVDKTTVILQVLREPVKAVFFD